MLLPKPPALRPTRAASTRPTRACNKRRIRLQRQTMVPIKGRVSNRDRGKIKARVSKVKVKVRARDNKVKGKAKDKVRDNKVRARVGRDMEAAAARMAQGTIKPMARRYTFQDRKAQATVHRHMEET